MLWFHASSDDKQNDSYHDESDTREEYETPIKGDALLGQPLAGQYVIEVPSRATIISKNPRMMSANASLRRAFLSSKAYCLCKSR